MGWVEDGLGGKWARWKKEGLREMIQHGQGVENRVGRTLLEQVLRVKEAVSCTSEALTAEEKQGSGFGVELLG